MLISTAGLAIGSQALLQQQVNTTTGPGASAAIQTDFTEYQSPNLKLIPTVHSITTPASITPTPPAHQAPAAIAAARISSPPKTVITALVPPISASRSNPTPPTPKQNSAVRPSGGSDPAGSTAPGKTVQLTSIIGSNAATASQLETLLHKRNPNAPNLAAIYFKMQSIYGIRADLAFLQMVKETGALQFEGDVKPSQHNPAGLGATGGGNPGYTFSTWEEGIEAQFQHLYAYASIAPLPAGRTLYDQRFKYVTRGYAPYIEWLGADDNPQNAGKTVKLGWAVPGNGYGASILNLLQEARTY